MSNVPASDCLREKFLDQSSIGRGAVGILMALTGVPVETALILVVAFELAESPLLDAMPDQFPHHRHDTLLAKTGDVLSAMAGYGLVKLFPNGR